jgi:hypothetical protein
MKMPVMMSAMPSSERVVAASVRGVRVFALGDCGFFPS